MSTDHLPPARLVADALTAAEDAHLAACPRCRVDRARAREFFADPPDDRPDRYEDRGLVSRGGMGEVRRVYDRQLGRVVAMKILHVASASTEASEDDQAWEIRFRREAEVLSRLDHPAIVPLYDRGVRADGALYYTMRLVGGGTLEERLAAARTLAERLALVPHFAAVCQAVAYAHRAGIVHRDLKPRNIMVGDFGETVVLDWGIAKVRGRMELVGKESAAEPGATVAGTVLGTPGYMSPEQAEGRADDVDARADVWSLGAVLHEILTGAAPTPGSSLARGARARSGPADLAAVAEKARSTVPGERYADAGELAAEVQAYLEGDRVRVYPYSSWELAARLVRQNRAAFAVALLAGIAGIAAGAQLVRTNGALEEARADEQRAGEATRRQLAATLVERGRQEVERNLPSLALPSFAAALRAVEGLPDESGARVRLQAALDASPRLLAVIPASDVGKLAMSDDGRFLAVGAARRVEVWDVARAERVGTIADDARPDDDDLKTRWWVDLAFSPDGLLAVRDRSGLSVWTVRGARVAGPAPDLRGGTGALQWTNDRRIIRAASVSHNRARSSWELDVPSKAWRIDGARLVASPMPTIAHAMSPDGRWFVHREASSDGITYYEVVDASMTDGGLGRSRTSFATNDGSTPRIEFSRHASIVAAVGPYASDVWMTRLDQADPRQETRGASLAFRSSGPVRKVAVSDDGQRLFVAQDDATVLRTVTAGGGSVPAGAAVPVDDKWYVEVAFGLASGRVAVPSRAGVTVWAFVPWPERDDWSLPQGGGWRWVEGRDRPPRLVDAVGAFVRECESPRVGVRGSSDPMTLSPDGRVLFWNAIGTKKNLYVHACDAVDGSMIRSFTHAYEVQPTASSEGVLVVGAAPDGESAEGTVYGGSDLSTVRWRGTGDRFRLSPDGRRIAVVTRGVTELEQLRMGRDLDGEGCLRRLVTAQTLTVHEFETGDVRVLHVPNDLDFGTRPLDASQATCDAVQVWGFGPFEWVGANHLAYAHGPHLHLLDVVEDFAERVLASAGGRELAGAAVPVANIGSDPGGTWVTAVDTGGTGRAWRVQDGRPLGTRAQMSEISRIMVDPSGRYLVALDETPSEQWDPRPDTLIFEAATGQWIGSWIEHRQVRARRTRTLLSSRGYEADPALVQQLRPSPWPVADWVDIAEVISGERLDAPGERIPAEERAQRLRALRARYPEL